MRRVGVCWGFLLLAVALLLAGALKFLVLGQTAPGDDGRTAVLLSPGERQKVLAEMRQLLEAVQGVLAALAEGDRARAAAAAEAVGMQATSTMDGVLMGKLPLPFKKMGFATHGGFDELAELIRSGAPLAQVQARLAQTMENCIACHATYQLPVQAP